MANGPAQTDRLVETHLAYAHAIAADTLKKLPSHVEKTEIRGAAELGLVEAASAYEVRFGVQFKTFAYYRIRGAVFDAIRKSTWFSRNQYKEFQAAAAATVHEELGRQVSTVVVCFMHSLESEKFETPVDPRQSAEERLIHDEWKARLAESIQALPEKNRQVLELYYFQNQTLEEIGLALGRSKSWTCRIHARAIELLREHLGTTMPKPSRATLHKTSQNAGPVCCFPNVGSRRPR